MCGITGYFGLNDSATIDRMTHTLRLRGPDDHGTIVFGKEKVALGHTRLSIIDLTSAGHQPMSNQNGSLWITYNGEIYNFMELREELETLGFKFKSRTDTEVILALYEEYGLKMVSRLNGIFSFALYDKQKGIIHLIRDHLGVKPLYYAFSNGKFFFGSEIKAILASGQITPEINPQALWDYLTFLYVPSPSTLYQGIFQIPSAHTMTLNLNTLEHSMERYWNPLGKSVSLLSDSAEIHSLVHSTLSQTVKEQMISDVPVGAFLSGGIDSNIVVGLMAEQSDRRVRTFTAIFKDNNADYFNEKKEAARIADKFNTIHEEIEVPVPSMEDIFSMLSWTDQPFGNPTLFLSYLISKKIKEQVTVALSGAGGDELFGGYVRYKYFSFARKIVRPFSSLMPLSARVLHHVWPQRVRPESRRRFYKFLSGIDPDMSQQYLKWTYFLDESQKKGVINLSQGQEPSGRILAQLFEESESLRDIINRLGYVDLQSYLRDDILEYTDKSSMAASLEVRVPFLSPKMVELSFRIPGNRKIRKGKTKVALKESFHDLIPRENLKVPKKGFSAPIRIWSGKLDKYFDQIERQLPLECPLNLPGIRKLREEHRTGQFNHGQILFGILMLEVWMVNSIYK